jgi:hypothetical protein
MNSNPNYIGLSYQFLNLAKEAINEMEKQGNRNFILSDAKEDQDDSWSEYENNTRWNDMNVGVPILFNFYHGLELMMKGLTLEVSKDVKLDHNIESIYKNLAAMQDGISQELISLFSKYIGEDSPFQQFFKDNNSSPKDFFNILKYPESKKKARFSFSTIRGNEDNGLKRFIEIRNDINNIRTEIIKWNTKRL